MIRHEQGEGQHQRRNGEGGEQEALREALERHGQDQGREQPRRRQREPLERGDRAFLPVRYAIGQDSVQRAKHQIQRNLERHDRGEQAPETIGEIDETMSDGDSDGSAGDPRTPPSPWTPGGVAENARTQVGQPGDYRPKNGDLAEEDGLAGQVNRLGLQRQEQVEHRDEGDEGTDLGKGIEGDEPPAHRTGRRFWHIIPGHPGTHCPCHWVAMQIRTAHDPAYTPLPCINQGVPGIVRR